MPRPSAARTATSARRLERASGALTTQAQQQMAATLPWFDAMPPDARAQVGVLVQAGIRGFGRWLLDPESGPKITAEVFATAPRELARVVSLEQTVQLVRVAVDVTEGSIGDLAGPEQQGWLREAVLRYSREIAFATAMVYARAAEQRGAWDARLEALVVDAVVRGDVSDAALSRAAALGWPAAGAVVVVAGRAPDGDAERVLDHVRHLGGDAAVDVLAGVHSSRLVVLVAVRGRTHRLIRGLLSAFASGPVVTGPQVEGLADATTAVQDAFAGLRAAAAWPQAPRPVSSEDLLAERALSGDRRAVRVLVDTIWTRLSADQPLLLTADTYIGCGGSIEASARELFVHPNTVRYRMRRIVETIGRDLADPRDRYVVQVALGLGRLNTQ